MSDALTHRERSNALHRLGVTLHAYVDTWAHQGFCGVVHEINRVKNLGYDDASAAGVADLADHVKAQFENILQHFSSDTLDDLMPLGHGAALTFPDQPWASWHYENGQGKQIQRNNLDDFMRAADMAYRVIRAFIQSSTDFANQPGLPVEVAATLKDLLSRSRSEDANERLEVLKSAVAAKAFARVVAIPPYVPTGLGSWKHQATGLLSDDETIAPVWDQKQFEDSHYRKFHDAVKQHRSILVNDILPKYGLRIA